jgi:hypothetical protein
MRSSPSFTLVGAAGNWNISDGTAGQAIATLGLQSATPYVARFATTGQSSLTTYRPYYIEPQNSTTYMFLSAEL